MAPVVATNSMILATTKTTLMAFWLIQVVLANSCCDTCDRRRCKIEQVAPRGAASIVYCNGLGSASAAAADDDDDDVICLDDEPPVTQNQPAHSSGCVAKCCNFCLKC